MLFLLISSCSFFFFNDTAPTEIYTLSLHDALPIYWVRDRRIHLIDCLQHRPQHPIDRKSTRLNSSHEWISYAVFCLKKKKNIDTQTHTNINNNRHNTHFQEQRKIPRHQSRS